MTLPAAAISHAAAASPASANDITPGVLGFLVIAAMAAVLVFLLRSMNKHLRRVRAVRDAGLAPGSDIGAAAVTSSANGVVNGSANANAAASSANSAESADRAESKVRTDPADKAGGAAGG